MNTTSDTKSRRSKAALAAVIGLAVGASLGRLYGSFSHPPAPVPIKETQVKLDASTRKGTLTAVVVRGTPEESFSYLIQSIQAVCQGPPAAITSVLPQADQNRPLPPGTLISITFECR